MRNKSYSGLIVPLLTAVLSLFVAYNLDRWVRTLTRHAFSSFNFSQVFWGALGANLVLAFLLLALVRVTEAKTENRLIMAVLYLVIGTLAIFTVASSLLLALDHPLLAFMSIPSIRAFRLSLLDSGFDSRFAITAAFIFILGLAQLLPRWGKR